MTAAAARTGGLEVTISNFDLILAKAGHGTNRCESVPFAALFLSDKDVLGRGPRPTGQGGRLTLRRRRFGLTDGRPGLRRRRGAPKSECSGGTLAETPHTETFG